MGHDTEHCFVLKNIVQDSIDKNLLTEDKKEDQSSWSSSIIQKLTTLALSQFSILL